MQEIEYKILSTFHPAPDKQLEKEFGKDGWILQTILIWEGKLYYHFIRIKDVNKNFSGEKL
jgi:hypothetical protein